MVEHQDAVMPALLKIQRDIADFREVSEAKANDLAENIHTVKDDVAELRCLAALEALS